MGRLKMQHLTLHELTMAGQTAGTILVLLVVLLDMLKLKVVK